LATLVLPDEFLIVEVKISLSMVDVTVGDFFFVLGSVVSYLKLGVVSSVLGNHKNC
jgi:hypothetical protein